MLRKGSRGSRVSTLQRKLNRLHFKVGLTGRVTGYFGRQTAAAVREFQCAYGLKQDGIVGPLTIAALSKNGQLSKNFHVDEFDCKGSGRLKLNQELITRLEHLRKLLGCPLHITSGYRSAWYNLRVGGVFNSQHRYGRAADVVAQTKNVDQVREAALKAGFKGVGVYRRKGFIHVDIRLGRKSLWYA